MKIQAWAVVVFEGDKISNCRTEGGLAGRAIFFDADQAKEYVRRYKEDEKKMDGDYVSHNPRVVRCTITI